MKNVFPSIIIVALCTLFFQAKGTNYYCDPISGSMSNSGSFSNPWSTLQAVFTANKTFQPGDTLFLRNGYHGLPTVTGINTGNVTIQPQPGHVPSLRRLTVSNAKYWTISGLKISPVYAGIHEKTTYVTIAANATFITLKKCDIFAMLPDSVAVWPADTVRAKLGDGILVRGRNCLITEDTIRETDFALSVLKSAPNSVVAHNYILHFGGDAMRGLADSCNFEYNKIIGHYSFPGDLNHPDAFQSWSLNDANVVGADTVKNIVIRGNIIINLLNLNQPFANDNPTYGLQGISNFDGFSKDWLIENNLVVTNMWHGIALSGAINCKIINNTVMPNHLQLNAYRPWIAVGKHKNGSSGYGNVEMNNLVFENSLNYDGTTVVTNIFTKDTIGQFVDFRNFNFHLRDTSRAVGSGTTFYASANTQAPGIDLEMAARTIPYEVGAYEYNASPLPVSLQSFTGKANGKDNMLYWSTASENNNTGFEVLYSPDNRFFYPLGFVSTKAIDGRSTKTLNYSFVDSKNTDATAYYQLRQVNKDGTASLSPTVCIKNNFKHPFISIVPNPVGNTLSINDAPSALSGKRVTISVYDVNGKKVKGLQKMVSLQLAIESIDVADLAPGIYFLEIVQNPETIIHTKFVKL